MTSTALGPLPSRWQSQSAASGIDDVPLVDPEHARAKTEAAMAMARIDLMVLRQCNRDAVGEYRADRGASTAIRDIRIRSLGRDLRGRQRGLVAKGLAVRGDQL